MIAITDESNLIFIVAAAAVICSVALSFASALPVALTIICGVLLTGVTPGYGWTYVIFPKKNIPLSHRALISIPLSIIITATCAFVMSAFLNLSLTPLAVRLALLVIALGGSGSAFFLNKPTHH